MRPAAQSPSLHGPLFKALLLDMAQERNVEDLLQLITTRLNQPEGVALVRIWLLDAADICDRCFFADECQNRSQCLQLVSSAGSPTNPQEDWGKLDGSFARFPLGVRKVGYIASHQDPVEVVDIDDGSHWIANLEWARREGIQGFVGQPLVYRGEILGVMGVFLRMPAVEDALEWLRMVADHTASALANARAFEEIEALRAQLALENECLRDAVKSTFGLPGIIGQSPGLQKVLDQVELVAQTQSTVLVYGESGVGKERIARAIHEQSPRKDGPLITVNCASIPRDLFESEFFGHIKGAFTGALRHRVGRFELADGGTLFLDEVGEIPLEMQSKLLRVLQEGTFERIGDDQTRQAHVRIVAATNRDLEAEVKAGRFRQDLYYRLSVFPIRVLPLRERKGDIPLLVDAFLGQFCRKFARPRPKLKRRHLAELEGYDWPGNIRELQNCVERAVIRTQNHCLEFDLPKTRILPTKPKATAHKVEHEGPLLTLDGLRALEAQNLIAVLDAHDWKIAGKGGAAAFMGMPPSTLASRIKALKIKR